MSVERSALNVERSVPKGAVFLSYAREDTDAAKRIAEALRGFGVEVWFDQAELHGGDAWDAKIRKQIRECALFVPLVSQQTEARAEGYFRREWKIAIDRTQDMGSSRTFIMPVVIDDTKETGADVPEEFMRYQWTRLSGGAPTPEFVTLVKRLLEAPRKPLAQKSEDRGQRPEGNLVQRKPAPGAALWISLGVVAVSVGVVFFVTGRRESTEEAARRSAPPSPKAATQSTPLPPSAADKSIAVLPFTNMSEDKDASAFFADGVHEDILTNLALMRDLRVISRPSVMEYRGTAKKIPQIGRELNVAYVLNGSVRRAGNRVRVVCQLIDARTDQQVWTAPPYDSDLTDVFAVQSKLAQAIATELKAAISPQEKSLIERQPTQNQAAYELYLQARSRLNEPGFSAAGMHQAAAFLTNALDHEPGFALGWALLSFTHVRLYFTDIDHSDARLAKAKTAIDTAMRLAPDSPQIIRYLGTYHYYGYRDYARAREEFERAGRLLPNDPEVPFLIGAIDRRQGRWPDALANLRRAVELDPANIVYLADFASLLQSVRRFDEAVAIQRRLVALRPDRLEQGYFLGSAVFAATGSREEMRTFFASMTPEQFIAPRMIELRKSWAFFSGDFSEAIRLDRLQPYFDNDQAPRHRQALWAAISYEAAGDVAGMRARLAGVPEQVRERLQREPNNADLWQRLGQIEAMLGNAAEAERCIDRAVALLPESRDALGGVEIGRSRAFVWVRTGKREQAIAEYARFLASPGTGTSVHSMRHGAFWAPLRGDSRWEAVLNDPKNHTPLF